MKFRFPKSAAPLPPSTHQLINQLCEGLPEDEVTLAGLLDQFQERAFGLFLFLALLPTFIPVPAGQGAVSGFLTSLIGLQFLLRFQHPWLPGFIANRKFQRSRIIGLKPICASTSAASKPHGPAPITSGRCFSVAGAWATNLYSISGVGLTLLSFVKRFSTAASFATSTSSV